MPLFDFFKKQQKQDPAAGVDKELISPEMQKQRYEAAMEFLKAFQEKIPLVGGKPHAGTVLSVAARITGTSLYRSMNYSMDAVPGTVLLSEEINQAWPPLMNLFAYYCKKNGFDIMSKPVVSIFPEKDKPLMSVEQVQLEYQDQYNDVMKKHGLDYLNGARTGIVVCSIVFQYHCAQVKDIDPHVAAGIIAMGIVEGAKTVPPPFGSLNTQIKPLKNMERLVLGEDKAVAKETDQNGGVFILINPGILKTLTDGKIDPYIIYEQALLNQIEAKIPRIDVVQADVDELYTEWNSKPEMQIPIYIKLIIWLKNNANAHGYEQDGNSWVKI